MNLISNISNITSATTKQQALILDNYEGVLYTASMLKADEKREAEYTPEHLAILNNYRMLNYFYNLHLYNYNKYKANKTDDNFKDLFNNIKDLVDIVEGYNIKEDSIPNEHINNFKLKHATLSSNIKQLHNKIEEEYIRG